MRRDIQYIPRMDIRVAQNKANINAAKMIATGGVIATMWLGFWKATILLLPVLVGISLFQKKSQPGGLTSDDIFY